MPDLESPGAQVEPLRAAELRQRLDAFESEYLVQLGSSPATAGTYKRSLREFIRWVSENQAGVVTLDTKSVHAYQQFINDTRQLAPTTVTTYLRALKHFCEYLVRYRLIASNPVIGISLDSQPPAQPRDILTQREADALLHTIDVNTELGARDHALAACMLHGGLNEVQLVQADVSDIEITAWGWQLRMKRAHERGLMRIALDTTATSSLENYLYLRRNRRMSDPLFVSHGHRGRGKRLTTRTVRNRITAVLRGAGITRPGITPNSLKQTALLLWLRKGMDLEEIRQRVTQYTLRARLNDYSERGLLTDGILGLSGAARQMTTS